MTYQKQTMITRYNGTTRFFSGHVTNPDTLRKNDAFAVTYTIIDWSGKGRGGRSRVEDVTGWGAPSLQAAANLA